MNIHCPALSSHGIPPDFIQNPVPGQYNPLIFQQEAEQFKFLQRQCHIFSIHADQVPGGVYSGRGYGIASNGGIQVWQRRGVFSRSRVIYYLRKSGDTLYYSPGKMKPRTGNAFRERLCRYVADDAELCRRIRSLDTWRDKTVLMLQEYHIGH